MEEFYFGFKNMSEETRNVSTDEDGQEKRFMTFVIFCLFLLFAIVMVGLIGNGIVIFLSCCRMKRTINSIWFLNLAIADFIYILSQIIIPIVAIWGKNIFYILTISSGLNQFASVFFLVVISVDRCLCTWKAVWAQNNRTVFRARIICAIVWVSSIGCILPCMFIDQLNLFFVVTYYFTVGFLIPFLIIASSYIAIAVRIKRLKKRKQFRSYRLIITVVLAFFICWFPFCVFTFCFINGVECVWRDGEAFFKAYVISALLVYLNSCLNPFLYVFMCDDYKKKLKQSLVVVLETAFAEDYLEFRADRNRQRRQDEQT